MGGFVLPGIAGIRREGVVERFAINVLRMRRQMATEGRRQVVIGAIGHRVALLTLTRAA